MLVKNNTGINFFHNEILWLSGESLELSEREAAQFGKQEGFEIVSKKPDHKVEGSKIESSKGSN